MNTTPPKKLLIPLHGLLLEIPGMHDPVPLESVSIQVSNSSFLSSSYEGTLCNNYFFILWNILSTIKSESLDKVKGCSDDTPGSSIGASGSSLHTGVDLHGVTVHKHVR